VSTFDRGNEQQRPPLPARLDPRLGTPPRNPRSRGGRDDGGWDDGSGAGSGSARTGRSGGTRLAIAARMVAGLVTVAVLAASGWGWYLGRVADASVNRTDAIPTEGNEGIGGGEAMNLLLVGNDSRASATEEQLDDLNTTAHDGINTDTMILVHVPADGSKA
jgi:hypothetical protein